MSDIDVQKQIIEQMKIEEDLKRNFDERFGTSPKIGNPIAIRMPERHIVA